MTGNRSFTGEEARRLLRRARIGTLATVNREGGIPYASLVNAATDVEGQPIILISGLAWHTRNLEADARASLLVAEPPPAGDALTGPRVTVMGRFARTSEPRIRRRYLARHPAAAGYADFGDFGFWRLEPEIVHAVAGFGRIETLAANEVFPSTPVMIDLEDSAIARMNTDHLAAVQELARNRAGQPGGDWKISAIDPDGVMLGNGGDVLRVDFGAPVYTANDLRRAMAGLVGPAVKD